MELEVDFTREWNNDAGHHTTTLVVGRVKMLYIRDDILDSEHGIVSTNRFKFFTGELWSYHCRCLGSQNPAASLPVSRFAGKLYSRSTQ